MHEWHRLVIRRSGCLCGADRSLDVQVEAVMRRIMWLLRDATAKVLVFSTWVDVIDLMAHALGTNGVRFAYPRSQAKFSRELAAFRSSAAAMQQPGAPGADARWDCRLCLSQDS